MSEFNENEYCRFRAMLKFFVNQIKNNQTLESFSRNTTKSHIGNNGRANPEFQRHYNLPAGWNVFANNLMEYRVVFDSRGNRVNKHPETPAVYMNIHCTWINIIPEFSDLSSGTICRFISKYRVIEYGPRGGLKVDGGQPIEDMPEPKYYNIDELGLNDNESMSPTSELKDMFEHQRRMLEIYRRDSQEIKMNDLITKAENALQSDGNIILHGAPGTGKTYIAFEIAADLTGVPREELSTSNQSGFVQFHPNYDYTDFVEGLRPCLSTNEKGSGNVGFELKTGVFKRFIDGVIRANESRKEDSELERYVFVVDEINRGDISRIFGELFFAIDPGYRGPEGSVTTQYANMHDDEYRKFYIPENVYIIGTMNDIDRSVDTFDFAMRRRFRFIEVHAKDTQGAILSQCKSYVELKRRMDALNNAIESYDFGLGLEYELGASYFTKARNEDGLTDFEALWSDFLEPLLREYLRGREDAGEVLEILRNVYNTGSYNQDVDFSGNDASFDS